MASTILPTVELEMGLPIRFSLAWLRCCRFRSLALSLSRCSVQLYDHLMRLSHSTAYGGGCKVPPQKKNNNNIIRC